MNVRERLRWGIGGVLVLSLAACSSGSSGGNDTADGGPTVAASSATPVASTPAGTPSASTSAGTTTTVDTGQVCGLVSKSQAASWLGGAVTSGKHSLLSTSNSLTSVDECLYKAANSSLAYNVYQSSQVTQVSQRMHAQFEAKYKAIRAQAAGIPVQKIDSGFGQTTFGASAQLGGVGLTVLDFAEGDYAVLIIASGSQARSSTLSVAGALDTALGG